MHLPAQARNGPVALLQITTNGSPKRVGEHLRLGPFKLKVQSQDYLVLHRITIRGSFLETAL